MSAIIERCVGYVKSIWEAIWDWLYSIGYTKPTTRWRPAKGWRHRALSPINVINFWLVVFKICLPTLLLPSICLVLWHTLSIRGCRSYPMRQIYRTIGTEVLCWQPPPLDKDHSWWLTLWDQSTDHPASLPEWIDGVLMGYHLIFDATAALQGQRLELENISLEISVANGLLDGKLIATTEMLTHLGIHAEIFSSTFCIEEDKINRAFRELVELFIRLLMSDFEEMTPASLVFRGSSYMVRFINDYFQVPWVPQSTIYSYQITAEIDFRLEEFYRASKASIEVILGASRPLDAMFQNRTLPTAIWEAVRYDSKVKEAIAHSSYRYGGYWIISSEDSRALAEASTLIKGVRKTLVETRQIIERNNAYRARAVSLLENFCQYLDTSWFPTLSSTSPIALKRSSDDPELIEGDQTVEQQVEVLKQSCKTTAVRREQIPICLIDSLRTIFGGMDNDLLGFHQRSWCTVREEAIERYEVKMGTDIDSVVKIVKGLH